MSDNILKVGAKLPPEQQVALQSMLDGLPELRKQIAVVKGLGVDTTVHENQTDAIELQVTALLKTFGG